MPAPAHLPSFASPQLLPLGPCAAAAGRLPGATMRRSTSEWACLAVAPVCQECRHLRVVCMLQHCLLAECTLGVAVLCCCSATYTDGGQTGNCLHADSSAALRGTSGETGALSGYKTPLSGPAPPPSPPRPPRPPPPPPASGTWANPAEASALPWLGFQLQVRAEGMPVGTGL